MNTRLSKTAKGLMVAAVAATTLVGTAGAASAQSYGYRDRGRDYCDSSGRQVAGTAFGAVAGAAIGSGVAGRGDRSEGAVIGGVLGALAGNAVSRNSARDCEYNRGYRDTRYGYQQGYGYNQPYYDVREERRYEREQRRYERQQRRYERNYGYQTGYNY